MRPAQDYAADIALCRRSGQVVMIYAQALRDAAAAERVHDTEFWSVVNGAVLKRYAPSGLIDVKRRAWKHVRGGVL